MALTVLHVPSLLDSGTANAFAEIEMTDSAYSFSGFCAVNHPPGGAQSDFSNNPESDES